MRRANECGVKPYFYLLFRLLRDYQVNSTGPDRDCDRGPWSRARSSLGCLVSALNRASKAPTKLFDRIRPAVEVIMESLILAQD